VEAIVLSMIGVWVLGCIPAIFVIRHRAGLGIWSPLRVTGAGGIGVGPLLFMVGKVMAWPATLAYWLLNDRPEPAISYKRLDVDFRTLEDSKVPFRGVSGEAGARR
jgi:hypothetical protein